MRKNGGFREKREWWPNGRYGVDMQRSALIISVAVS